MNLLALLHTGAGRLARAFDGLMGFIISDPEYEKMSYGGHEWDIVDDDGKRLTLRRPGRGTCVIFGKVFTYSHDWVTRVKRVNGSVIPITRVHTNRPKWVDTMPVADADRAQKEKPFPFGLASPLSE